MAHFCLPFHMLRAGYGSESEADDEAATVSLATDLGRVNRVSTKSAVKLQEIGPRMTLQLMKIEEGLCSGVVIFNAYGNSDAKMKQDEEDEEEEDNDNEEEEEEEEEEEGDIEEVDEEEEQKLENKIN